MSLTHVLNDLGLRRQLANYLDGKTSVTADDILTVVSEYTTDKFPDPDTAVGFRDVIVPALSAYLSETDSYLRSFRGGDTPGPEDTCCDIHLGRWQTHHDMKAPLLWRRKRIAAAMKAFGEKPWKREK